MKNLSTDKRSVGESLLARLKQTCEAYALTKQSLRKSAMMILLCLSGFSAQAQTWTGTSISTAARSTDTEVNTVFLYNVGKKQWLCRGGHWGTEAVLSDVGTPFSVVSSGRVYKLKTIFKTEASSYSNSYLTFSGVDTSSGITHDMLNYYVDQNVTSYNAYTFTSVSTTDGSTQYQISNGASGTTYYMVGAYNQESTSLADHTDQVNAFTSDDLPSDNSDKWIVVTLKERKQYFSDSEATFAAPAPATFLINDYNFARRDEGIAYWKYQKGSDVSSLSYGKNGEGEETLGNPSQAQADQYNYYVGCGYNNAEYDVDPITGDTLTGTSNNLQQYYGGMWTANIHGVEGAIYQTVDDLFRAGWYSVKARVFTTATQGNVKLFASVGGATEKKVDLTDYDENDVLRISADQRPATYVDGWKLVNTTKTVSGETVYTYDVSVAVYVKEKTGSLDELSFGVRVSDADNAAWTCMDEFRLTYLGESENNIVVLDEDQTNVDYINTQAYSAYANGKKSTVYLHRTLKTGQWNSIVLPIALPGDAISAVFGTGTKVAEFKGALDEIHPNRIYFETTTDIQPLKLYIIKPTKEPQALLQAVVSSAADDVTLAQGTPCYTIAGMSFSLDTDQSFSSKIYGEIGDETYASDVKVQFVGTLVKLSDDNLIPAYSYVLNAADGLWYYRTVTTQCKGFRGWLETVDEENELAKGPLQVVIDDEATDVTVIDGVTVDNSARLASQKIYNLNGQLVRTDSTTNLAKGIYIVGGKKVVVR